MDQWQGYQDASGAPRRYNGTGQMTPNREYPPQQPAQPHSSAGFKYDQYQSAINPHPAQSSVASPAATPRDGYPVRPHHQSHLSGSTRPPNLHSPPEPSAAAQRYSPMEVLAPASPYGSKVASNQAQFSTSHGQRQSPTRSDYPSTSPYYSRQGSQQLPPMAPFVNTLDSYSPSAIPGLDGGYANDGKPQRRPSQAQVANMPTEKRPVPQLKKIDASSELRPRMNAQPAFRRANPEGGFISVRLQTPDSRL